MATTQNESSLPLSKRDPRLDETFELTSDAVALISLEYAVLRANSAWLEMHGFERDEEHRVIGSHLSSFHSRSDADSDLVSFLSRLSTVGAAQAPLAQLREGGEGFQTWTRGVRVGASSPFGAAYLMLSRDLSAERTAAKALRQTTGFLDSIMGNIPDMVFVKGASDLRFVFLNRAGEELLGCTQSDIVGKTDRDFFAPEEAEAFEQRDRSVLAGREIGDIPEEPVHTPKNGVRWLRTKRIPILDGAGRPLYLLGISEDVTTRRAESESREKLLVAHEAVKLRDEFLSIASHQLNNPLGAALLHAGSLARQARECGSAIPPQMTHRIGELHRVLVRTSEMVRELLDVSKMDAGRFGIRREDVDLSELLSVVVDTFSEQLSQAGCELIVEADAGVVGYWDRLCVEQIVVNLLSNALKYGRGKPILITATHSSDSTAQLTVQDHGVGIPLEDQAEIFERFGRANSTRSVSGFGLGLWIAQQFALAHDGSISVVSVPGRGSAFTVTLPVRSGRSSSSP